MESTSSRIENGREIETRDPTISKTITGTGGDWSVRPMESWARNLRKRWPSYDKTEQQGQILVFGPFHGRDGRRC
jgi:hypothetical protein